jgi:hypothetical protein
LAWRLSGVSSSAACPEAAAAGLMSQMKAAKASRMI